LAIRQQGFAATNPAVLFPALYPVHGRRSPAATALAIDPLTGPANSTSCAALPRLDSCPIDPYAPRLLGASLDIHRTKNREQHDLDLFNGLTLHDLPLFSGSLCREIFTKIMTADRQLFYNARLLLRKRG